MKQIEINPANKPYYTGDFIKGFECGTKTQFDADKEATNNAIIIPSNATNGDALIRLYPNLKYTIQNGRVVTTIGVAASFDLDWWNEPYKGMEE